MKIFLAICSRKKLRYNWFLIFRFVFSAMFSPTVAMEWYIGGVKCNIFFPKQSFFLPFHLNAGFIVLCPVTNDVAAHLMAVKWIKLHDEWRPLTIEDHKGKKQQEEISSCGKSSSAAKWKRFSADFLLEMKFQWKQAFGWTETCDNLVGEANNFSPNRTKEPSKHTPYRLTLNGIYCEIPGKKLPCLPFSCLVSWVAADVVL